MLTAISKTQGTASYGSCLIMEIASSIISGRAQSPNLRYKGDPLEQMSDQLQQYHLLIVVNIDT